MMMMMMMMTWKQRRHRGEQGCSHEAIDNRGKLGIGTPRKDGSSPREGSPWQDGPLSFSRFHLFCSLAWMLRIFIKMRGISSTVQGKWQKILTLTVSLTFLLPGSIFQGKSGNNNNNLWGEWSGLTPLRLLRLLEQDCGAKNQPGTNLNPSLSAWSHQKIGNSQRRKVPWSAQHHQCCLLVYGTKKRTSNDLGPLTPNSGWNMDIYITLTKR